MTSIRLTLSCIKSAIQEVCRILEQENNQQPLWTSMSEEELWRELVACILGSRVRYDVAYAAVDQMERANLFSAEHRFSERDEFEKDIIRALSETIWQQGRDRFPGKYPFPKLRASQISAAAQKLYSEGGSIRRLLTDKRDLREVRRHLATEVPGLGPKQASLFLRNIGFAFHIAVLDVHVLTYMHWIGLISPHVKFARTIRQYETLEWTFIEHSYSVGFPPNLYDIAVWVVIRLIKKEYVGRGNSYPCLWGA